MEVGVGVRMPHQLPRSRMPELPYESRNCCVNVFFSQATETHQTKYRGSQTPLPYADSPLCHGSPYSYSSTPAITQIDPLFCRTFPLEPNQFASTHICLKCTICHDKKYYLIRIPISSHMAYAKETPSNLSARAFLLPSQSVNVFARGQRVVHTFAFVHLVSGVWMQLDCTVGRVVYWSCPSCPQA